MSASRTLDMVDRHYIVLSEKHNHHMGMGAACCSAFVKITLLAKRSTRAIVWHASVIITKVDVGWGSDCGHFNYHGWSGATSSMTPMPVPYLHAVAGQAPLKLRGLNNWLKVARTPKGVITNKISNIQVDENISKDIR